MKKSIPINHQLYLDCQTNELHYFKFGMSRPPIQIQLDAKMLGVLKLLLENKGQLVNRPDFIEVVWEGNYLVGEKG